MQIPARLTYDGSQVTATITNTAQTFNTDWYTELGVPINPDDIDKYAQPVTKDGKTYVVTAWTFTVEPYDESGTTAETIYSVEVLPETASIASNGHVSLTSYYVGKQGDTEVSRINVTNVATWTSNNNYVIVNGGSVSGNNTSSSTTRSSRVTAAYSGKSAYCDITVGKASGSTVTYQLVVNPASMTIPYNGSEQLTAKFYTITDGHPDEGVDVTRNPNCIWTSSDSSHATVSSDGIVSGHNDSSVTQDVTARITATYNQTTGACQVTVTKSGGETGVTTYELSISATPSSIAWNGSSWLTAEYVTRVDGRETSRVPVSPENVTWEITKNPGYGTINATTGEFVANNQSLSGTNREIKIKGTYAGTQSNEVAIQVSKRPPEETTHELKVEPKTGSIGSADTMDIQAWFYTYEAGSLEPTEILNVTEFADCTWTSNKYDVATVSAGHVVSDNQTYAEQNVLITASYCGYTDDCAIKVAPKEGEAPEYYYTLVVVPTAVTLEYSGFTQLQAEFRTYEGTSSTAYTSEVVTTACTWSTNNQLVFVDNDLNKGMIESKVYNSAGTEADITAVYVRAYSSFTGTSHVTVNGKFIDFDIDTTPFRFECSEQSSATRQITTTDDVTWHCALVDVEHIGADVDWVTVTPENGSGSGVITLTINEENSGSTVRECFVLVHYPADSHDYKEITVAQYPTPRFSAKKQSVTAPQLGSTERVLIDTNYPISGDNGGYDWISVDWSRADSGYNFEITTTETNVERSGSVNVTTMYTGDCLDASAITLSVFQEYVEPGPSGVSGYVYLYRTEQSEPEGPLSYTVNAAEHDIELWYSSSFETYVNGISGTGLTVKLTNGVDVSDGTIPLPVTGLQNKAKLIVHIPKNQHYGSQNDRDFAVQFRTITQQNPNQARLEVRQYGDHYTDNSVIKFFEFDDQGLGQDEITINSGQIFIQPYVYIESHRIYDSGTEEVARISDYVINGGVNEDKIQISAVASDSVAITMTTDVGHGGSYNASLDYPFELLLPANQGLAETGETRDVVLTLTYSGIAPKTFTIHQLYSQKQLDPVDMHILSGSSHITVDLLEARPAQNARIIGEDGTGTVRIQGETGVTIVVTGEASKFTIDPGTGVNIGQPYDLGPDNGKDLNLTNIGTTGQHYQILISCSKANRTDKTLTIDVTVQ